MRSRLLAALGALFALPALAPAAAAAPPPPFGHLVPMPERQRRR